MENSQNSSILGESSLLEEELAHYDELLISSTKERIEMGSKYQDLSLKFENMINLQNSSSSSYDSAENEPDEDAAKHEVEKCCLKHEAAIAAYKENQDRQARIVSDLQSTVEEYRIRYAKLEAALAEQSALEASIADTESQSPNAFSLDLDTALIRLEQEKNRCNGLTQINNALREQLETATDVNQTLTSDVQRLTREWQSARAELLSKESEWKEEEQTFSFYFSKESNLLLKLWREVLDFKRDFSALKRFTELELSSFQGSMGHGMQSVHEVQRALASRLQGYDTTDRASVLPQILSSGIAYKSESAEVARLQNKISDLTVQNDRIQQLLDDKEKSSTLLCSVVEKMNEAFNQPVSLSHPTVVNSQQERLCNQYSKAFEDIFQVLLEEGNCDISSLISVEESSSSSFGSAFGPLQLQSIVSAVKKSMQKYNKQVEEYKLQLASSKEQNLMHQRTIEFLEEERQKGHQVNTRLSSQNESLNLQMKEMFQELKSKDIDKQSEALEAALKSLNEQLENARLERDHLTKLKEELYSKLQMANDEKRTLRHSEQTLTMENERNSQIITSLEKNIETLRKDYQASQESLHKTSLARDLLEQDKSKFTTDLTNLKQQFFEQNQWLKDLKEKYMYMEDSLATLQTQTESLALEKADLSKAYDKAMTELESMRSSRLNAKLEFEEEKRELKLQVERLQELATELEAERDRLKEELQRAEESRQSVEDERSEISIRNNDLSNQVTQFSSQKQSLEQELEEVRRELTAALEELARLSEQGLDRTRSAELMASQLMGETDETEMMERLKEELEAMREEKGLLEEKAMLAAREVAEMAAEKGEVERELDGRRAAAEALEAQIKGFEELREKYVNDSAKEKKSLLMKMQEIEQEFQLSLKNKDEQHNLEKENLIQEKAALRKQMVSAIDELFEKNQKEQDELQSNHQEEVESLKKEISAHKREYEDKIRLLEEERKKIRSDYETQISSYEERIQKLKKELDQKEELIGQLEEKISAADREKETKLKQYNEEMQSLKEELGSWSSKHSNEISNIQKKMSSLQQEKETALSDLHKLELRLKEVEAERNKMAEELENKNANYSNEKSFKAELEDKLTSLQAQLSNEQNQREVVNKLLEDCKDRIKVAVKENGELKRQLDEAQQEFKDKEASYSKVQSQNGELKSTLLEVEKSRQELKREIHGLKRTVSSQEKSLKSKDQEISDLNALHAREEEIQEGLKKEIVALRQKTLERSASSEALSKELSSCKQRCGELEHKLQLLREQHKAQLEESLSSERGSLERRLGLERSVAEASREIYGLRSELSWEEGKVLALESKIAKLDGSKREVENKLFAICVFLRSLLGLGSDSGFLSNPPPSGGSFQRSASSERLLGSPQRSSNRSVQFSASDMDVELLKTSLTDFVHRADAAKKETTELKDVIGKLQKEEAALRAEHSLCASTIYQLKRASEDKKILEDELASNIVRVARSEETIRTLEREKKMLADKVDGAEFLSSAASKGKEALQSKLFELKKTRAKLQEEVSSLQAARESAENRALKYIKAYQNLEADLLSAKDALAKRDEEAKSLEQEVAALTKKLKSSERQVKSLQWDLDNLREQSERLAENEKRLKQQVSSMSATLSQTSASQQSLYEELERKKQENSAKQEKLLTFMQANNQLRDEGAENWSKYEVLLNQTKELQMTLAQEEVARKELHQQVEKHKSMLLASQKAEREAELEVERLEREKRSLEERIRSISATLRTVQEEHQLCQSMTKEAKSLTEKLEKEKARSSDLSAKLKEERGSFRDSKLKIETENQRLLIRIQNLQAQLAEMEERHSQRVKEFLSSSESRLQESSLKKALRQTQELMKAKEKTHRQKILGLEEQIRVLQSHIESELQRSRELGRRSRGASSNIGHLQSVLSHSLHCVSEDPHQLLPEAERLDQATEAELRASRGELRLDTPSRLRRRPSSLPRTSTPKASSASSKS